MNTEEKDEPILEKIEYIGSIKNRAKRKMKIPKTKKKNAPISGTLFKAWCYSYEVIEGDSMRIKQADIEQATGISVPCIHHAWNDQGKSTKRTIKDIVIGLPKIVKSLIDKKYYHLSESERTELLRKAPMLTEDELEEMLNETLEF